MPGSINAAFGQPPLQTPLLQQADQTGVPFQNRSLPTSGLNTQWMAWFNALYAHDVLTPRMVSVSQSQLTSLAAFLGTFDAVIPPHFDPATGTVTLGTAPILAYVSDFNHTLQWNGTGWEWGPGDSGSGMLVSFAVAPTGAGWHACNGSPGVPYLKSDGTIGTVTLPNTASTAAYIKETSAYSATITAAVGPTISTPTFTGSSDTTSGPSGTITFPVGTGSSITVANSTHTHTVTPTGTISTPTSSLSGDPIANFSAMLYFRQ
jgi:hypothetical protein